MKINCIVIDDEPLARKGIKEYISDVEFLNFSGEYDNPVNAMEQIRKGDVDLIFLDIEMPKITGLDFLKSLQKAPPVIFTTAYPQYALEGYEVNALDYLLKPVAFDRFLKACLKAKEYYEVREQNEMHTGVNDYFFVKTDNKLVKLLFDEVLYIEALQNYVMIYTKSKKYMTYLTFKSVEEYLPADKFIKVHKSFIVAAAHIDSIVGNDIRIGEQHIPISRNQKEEVMEKLLKNRFLKR
jgi:DNA-binding LytR/AlgR family response regulator